MYLNLYPFGIRILERNGGEKYGESWRDHQRRQRRNRSPSRLGESRVHLPHLPQYPSPLRFPHPIRYTPVPSSILLLNVYVLNSNSVAYPHFPYFFSEATTKSKLASLNEKLDTLERRLELLEVQVGTATANPSLFNT
ncbi:Protein BRICK 1 [Linum perenne]